jgi:hypothetical protein
MKLDWNLFVRYALKRIEGIRILFGPPKKLQKLSLSLIPKEQEAKTSATKTIQRIPQNGPLVYSPA